jgi:hypothetical protein
MVWLRTKRWKTGILAQAGVGQLIREALHRVIGTIVDKPEQCAALSKKLVSCSHPDQARQQPFDCEPLASAYWGRSG